jgi:hypothetical protein
MAYVGLNSPKDRLERVRQMKRTTTKSSFNDFMFLLSDKKSNNYIHPPPTPTA